MLLRAHGDHIWTSFYVHEHSSLIPAHPLSLHLRSSPGWIDQWLGSCPSEWSPWISYLAWPSRWSSQGRLRQAHNLDWYRGLWRNRCGTSPARLILYCPNGRFDDCSSWCPCLWVGCADAVGGLWNTHGLLSLSLRWSSGNGWSTVQLHTARSPTAFLFLSSAFSDIDSIAHL